MNTSPSQSYTITPAPPVATGAAPPSTASSLKASADAACHARSEASSAALGARACGESGAAQAPDSRAPRTCKDELSFVGEASGERASLRERFGMQSSTGADEAAAQPVHTNQSAGSSAAHAAGNEDAPLSDNGHPVATTEASNASVQRLSSDVLQGQPTQQAGLLAMETEDGLDTERTALAGSNDERHAEGAAEDTPASRTIAGVCHRYVQVLWSEIKSRGRFGVYASCQKRFKHCMANCMLLSMMRFESHPGKSCCWPCHSHPTVLSEFPTYAGSTAASQGIVPHSLDASFRDDVTPDTAARAKTVAVPGGFARRSLLPAHQQDSTSSSSVRQSSTHAHGWAARCSGEHVKVGKRSGQGMQLAGVHQARSAANTDAASVPGAVRASSGALAAPSSCAETLPDRDATVRNAYALPHLPPLGATTALDRPSGQQTQQAEPTFNTKDRSQISSLPAGCVHVHRGHVLNPKGAATGGGRTQRLCPDLSTLSPLMQRGQSEAKSGAGTSAVPPGQQRALV